MNENKTIRNIFVGVGISLIITIISLIIFSIILTYTKVQENVINPVIMIITAISILIGSSIVNAKIKKNGLINGGIVGRNIYDNNILNIKYFKLEVLIKCSVNNNDCS